MSLMDKLIVWSLPFVPKPIVGYFSKNYISGPNLEDAVRVIKDLNSKGMMATMDLLGEESKEKSKAQEAAEEYVNILKTIHDEKLDSNVSVKPTQMGLLIDKEICYQHIRRILETAKQFNNFVRIDMEDRHCTTETIEIFLRLKEEFENYVGTVIQAYLRRTSADITNLIKHKANLRLCKGIYVEPREAAYKDMAIINENYKYNLEKLLAAGCYVGIATHDEELVWHALSMIEKYQLKPEQYEFQMLLGVDEKLRQIIIDAGHRLRVYVPYGQEWYAYSTRRLKENPKMAGYVFKAIFNLS
ncbi:MAG: proline dehydrogenase family protein [Calditrichaceae bacterium]|nr:proline dehydrogenase family protein [Calditrichaceae bacterium]HES59348.1 proline dehydrogenase [Caldithrix sp.]